MLKCWRLLVCAAALNVTAGAVSAIAQTVMVRNVPAGTKIEVLLNGAPVGSGAADATAQASVPLTTGDAIAVGGMDANIALDVCSARSEEHTSELQSPM